ncbi:hypothetical protein FRC09_019934 [Ceratobasidium sp. 395]|nr:hypothetical protein FRC09_019934 [Ceratobasidium sp. 395]
MTQWLEALRIHCVYLNEHYGNERKGEAATTAMLIADKDHAHKPEGQDQGEGALENVDEEFGDDSDDGEDLEGRWWATWTSDTNEVYHPAPELAITMRPTCQATLAEADFSFSQLPAGAPYDQP